MGSGYQKLSGSLLISRSLQDPNFKDPDPEPQNELEFPDPNFQELTQLYSVQSVATVRFPSKDGHLFVLAGNMHGLISRKGNIAKSSKAHWKVLIRES